MITIRRRLPAAWLVACLLREDTSVMLRGANRDRIDVEALVRTRRMPALLVVLAVVFSTGCVSMTLPETSYVYYTEGPEEALEVLETSPVRPRDQALALMEEAMALLELGRYEESLQRLERCAELVRLPDPAGAAASVVGPEDAKLYRGEIFERVYLHTLAMVDALALQDAERAARFGADAIEEMRRHPCPGCRDPFTLYLAAVSRDLAGTGAAEELLAEAVADGPGNQFLADELDRLARPRARSAAVAGLAPPPVEAHRSARVLYVLLLLGRAPVKAPAAAAVPWSHRVSWPVYEELPQVVSRVLLRYMPATEHEAVPLTDMVALARASLQARRAALVAKETGKTVVQEIAAEAAGAEGGWTAEMILRSLFSIADVPDLRSWSTLPASCQVLRVELPGDLGRCELLYVDDDGTEIDREELILPESWVDGQLFVARRMP